MIDVRQLTLTYPSGKGVFDLNFRVKQGEVVGYLGPNGAGKTTTIRTLMGFMAANRGTASINSLNCFTQAPEVQKHVGYIPGEISFLEGMRGDEYLKFISDLRGLKDTSRQAQLLAMFELSPKGNIRRYSKGMKQKLGIVAAFQHDPEVLILDEPTSGLDPLMQNRFISLLLEEKARGKTILLSSHVFEEVERTCDHVLIIKEGRIIAKDDVASLKNAQRKGFVLKTANPAETAQTLAKAGFETGAVTETTTEVFITGDNIDRFGKILGQFTLLGLDAVTQTLEDVFLQYYAEGAKKQ